MTGEGGLRPPRPDPLADRLATVVAPRYVVGARLGRGGMAIVFDGRDTRLDRSIAIKVIDPEKIFEDASIARFKAEASVGAGLRHPHIVAVHDSGETDDLVWFVMDKVSGGSLRDLLRREGRLPAPRVARILAQVSGALHHAHRNGVLHRDINPANILMDPGGNAFVSDFGIAKIEGSSTLTETGAAVGTAQYMSPEQLLLMGKISAASDQFSLGVTAFEMLSGSRPFAGDTTPQLAVAVDGGVHRDLHELAPECPADLRSLVHGMLARDPGDRWPDLGAVQRIAEEIAVTGVAPSMKLVRAVPAGRRLRKVMWLTGAVSMAAAAGWIVSGGLWTGLDSQSPAAPESPLPVEADTAPRLLDPDRSQVEADTAAVAPPGQVGPGASPTLNTRRASTPDGASGFQEFTGSVRSDSVASPSPPARGPALILIGSKGTNVYLYVNDATPVRLGALAWLPIPSHSKVRLSIRSQGCRILEELIELKAGDTLTVGNRNPDCPPPDLNP